VYDDLSPNRDGVISTLGAFAIQSHELFNELVSAGFTEQQALNIVVGLASRDKD